MNWFGMESHPTDTYIHWSEKNPKEKAIKLREEFDNIICFVNQTRLQFLLDSAYEAGRNYEMDSDLD